MESPFQALPAEYRPLAVRRASRPRRAGRENPRQYLYKERGTPEGTMSYIRKSLGANEQIVAEAHFHWSYTLGSILLALTIVGLIFAIPMWIRRATTEIAVTSHRLVKKTGWLSLHTEELSLTNIEGVKVDQGFWGRLLGFGHVRIEGTGVDAVQLPTIADPVAFRAAIETAKDSLPKR
jgi:membrane protein YdbS with pleckstrin-like domain